MILAGCLLLEHAGQPEAGERTLKALEASLRSEVRTRDLGGSASTEEFANQVTRKLG